MRQKLLFTFILMLCSVSLFAQEVSSGQNKKRLDFAKMYFELGSNFSPSFTGKKLVNNEIVSFENSASSTQYLNWGAFHFWGHAEFYVTFPVNQLNLKKNNETDFTLTNYVVTGARFLPWAFREKKIRPYVGVSWGAIDFQQRIKPEENQPILSKEFLLVPETGLMYGYKSFMIRLGLSYNYDNKWNYPLSRTIFSEIETPKFNFQLGLNYSFESSKNEKPEDKKLWNSYPRTSSIGYNATKFGDFFIAIGPSLSFSLSSSEYNKTKFPYLKGKLTSTNYYDIAVGYQFNKLGLFTALSFRNPKFETEGYSAKQTIKKTSFAFEINKFITDYTGFAPYIGLNLAYDKLKYSENVDNATKGLTFNNFEPGITFGWDIVPGKTSEALILRTNLRWYPYSSFKLDKKSFNFSQLEYNLIQVVFYPERLKRKK
ncbi:hypothetical protein [Flavivirga algicola]|uniref:Outer membrane protein beta-barrel domain-containing protein n=1 Tax=Flavivirga algicola TaxID=2729136 RepID=A0ABX1S309_9FLAO|nr:hypothetical protein [Flavivirga algicola]NMH89603.1 hypothetical protein [Flavivirga algicola]